MPPRRSGKGVKDALVKASELARRVAETKIISDLAKASGNPVAGKILDNLGLGRKRKAPRKGKGLFDFLGMGKKKAPARKPKVGGWGWLKSILKAPVQVVAPALAGAIMGTSQGLQGGIDSAGNGRRRRTHRGGMKTAVYTPASQLTR